MAAHAKGRSALLNRRVSDAKAPIASRRAVLCRAEAGSDGAHKKVVVLGGTGRVGSATAASLITHFKNYEITVAGRQRESYDKICELRPPLRQARYQQCDIRDAAAVRRAIEGADLVLHTAGPFQHSKNFNVIEAAIAAGIPYVDVCDDTEYSKSIKEYHDRAVAAGVPALTTAGIYPGTSNVMAAHIISIAAGEYDDNWNYVTPQPGKGVKPTLLRYSYYTAGSGGAGRTILETSFLLAGEECTVWKEGKAYQLPPISQPRDVDFGPGLGRKGVYLYNLPEVYSGRRVFNVPGISARFGTDPPIWNWAMWSVARLCPKQFLQDRSQVAWLAALSEPWVRLVDKIAGEKVGMRIEVDFEGGKNSAGLYVHEKLPAAMGNSVAAFAHAVLSGQTKPGVWYPEEKEALSDRRAFLRYAAEGCTNFDLNRPAWALDSPIKQIGLIYW